MLAQTMQFNMYSDPTLVIFIMYSDPTLVILETAALCPLYTQSKRDP